MATRGGERNASPRLPDWKVPLPKGTRPVLNPTNQGNRPVNLADDVERDRFSTGNTLMEQSRVRKTSPSALEAASTRRQGGQVEPTDDELDALGNEGEEQEQEFDESELDVSEQEGVGDELITDEERELIYRLRAEKPRIEREVAALHAPGPASITYTDTRTKKPAPVAKPSGVQIRAVVVEDSDRLWDWIRNDGDQGEAFFSRPLKTSQDLHNIVKGLVQAEFVGTGLIRSIYWSDAKRGDQHLGFAALVPILSTEHVALMHVYLAPHVRNNLANIAPTLIEMANELLPSYHLAVWSRDDSWRRLHRQLLAPLGFVEQTLFIR